MATIGGTLLTYSDWAKRLDPSGRTSLIVDILAQENGLLDDMMAKEGNLPTGEQTSIMNGYPTVYWRLMNKGVPNSKATTVQVTEQCGNLSARSQIDQDTAELNGNVKDFRLSESTAFIHAMSNEVASTMFYGSAANPEEFVGFANRYASLSAANGQNILDAGGTGSDNTSIWLIGWGPQVHAIFPKGSKAGLQHEDLGLGDAFDSDNNRFRAYMDLYKWKVGLAVKNWKYAVRIANVDVSDLVAATGTQASTAATAIIKMMSRSLDRFPSMAGIKPSFCCSRTVASHLRIAALDKSASVLSVENSLNQLGDTIQTLRFSGVPVRICDALSHAEARVT